MVLVLAAIGEPSARVKHEEQERKGKAIRWKSEGLRRNLDVGVLNPASR
jgi:hypothetical protein